MRGLITHEPRFLAWETATTLHEDASLLYLCVLEPNVRVWWPRPNSTEAQSFPELQGSDDWCPHGCTNSPLLFFL